jgi:cell division septum initiation protein DivIVA
MELTQAQQLVATLSEERDEAVERLTADAGSGQGPSVEVGGRVSAILSLADEEAGQLRTEAEQYADELRRSAEAEANRIRAGAAETADRLVREADQAAETQREAVATRQAELADAERGAAQIIESARREAELETRRARADTAEADRARDRVATDLHGVLEVLARLQLEMRDDDDTPVPSWNQREPRPTTRAVATADT